MTEIWAAMIAALGGVAAAGLGLFGRRQARSAARVRR